MNDLNLSQLNKSIGNKRAEFQGLVETQTKRREDSKEIKTASRKVNATCFAFEAFVYFPSAKTPVIALPIAIEIELYREDQIAICLLTYYYSKEKNRTENKKKKK